jgi:hypothetical protein
VVSSSSNALLDKDFDAPIQSDVEPILLGEVQVKHGLIIYLFEGSLVLFMYSGRAASALYIFPANANINPPHTSIHSRP